MEGIKYDSEKLDWTLFPWSEATEVMEVLMGGAKKYAPNNWKKLENGEKRCIAAAMRHIIAHLSGEDINKDDFNLSHLAHAACGILFAMYFMNQRRQNEETVS